MDNKSSQHAIRFDPEDLDALRAAAQRLDRSIAWIVRLAVQEWLKRQPARNIIASDAASE